MTEEERLKWLKCTLLLVIDLSVDFNALKLALIRQNRIDAQDLLACETRFREVWKEARETVMRLGEESGPSLDELLTKFPGPIQ